MKAPTSTVILSILIMTVAACGDGKSNAANTAGATATNPNAALQQPATPAQPITPPRPAEEREVFNGNDANQLINALLDSGLSNSAQGEGALVLDADMIVCDSPVVAQPVPTCEITASGSPLTVKPADAAVIFNILVKEGAVINNGLLGNQHAVMVNVQCTQPVTANPVGQCALTFGTPND